MTRYRNESVPQAPGVHTSVTFDGVVTTSYIEKLPLSNRGMTDEVVANFKERSAKGEVFNNPLSSFTSSFEANDTYRNTRTRRSDGKSTVDSWTNGALLTYYHNTGSFLYPVVPLSSMEAALTQSSVAAQANVNKTAFDASTFVVEWSKTRQLHRDALNAVWKVFTEGARARVKVKGRLSRVPLLDASGVPILRKDGRPVYRYLHTKGEVEVRGALQNAQNLSNLYLVGRFGVAPLLRDLEDATKLLLRTDHRRNTARGSASLQGTASSEFSFGDALGTFKVNLNTTRTWSVRHGILYDVDALTQKIAALGLTRPLSTAWEVTRYSFVFDYLLNVGRWLDAIQPSGASRTLSAWVSTSETVVQTASISANHSGSLDGSSDIERSWNGGLTRVMTVKSRQPWVPSMPKYPPLGEGLTQLRSLDLATLVLQRIRARL